jgi:peptidoglycan/xylan/chitin deacetylase (PgdA/CDA1 family)
MVTRKALRARLASRRMLVERACLTLRWSQAIETSRILCYHAVGTPQWGVNNVSPARFERHLQLALSIGYTFVSAAELAASEHQPDAKKQLAVTFDDGLRSIADNAAPILERLNIPWSVFVVTDWAEGKHPQDPDLVLGWAEIADLAGRGATVGSHSCTHPDFGLLSADQAERELVRSRELIESRLGVRTQEFAIPLGQQRNWNQTANELARQAGYTRVYAQAESTRLSGTIPRTFVSVFDGDLLFRGALRGAFANWEEWY